MITDLTPEQILAANVSNKSPDPETTTVEQQIRKAEKGFTFSMKVSSGQVQLLSRFANVVGLEWQSYLAKEIEDKILSATTNVGSPLVKGPSVGKGAKVMGPSGK